jgi:hypothetical protein
VPTHATDKLARWQSGICPMAVGLKPEFLKFITQRIRDAAVKAGTPVSADPHCTPNIQIVFTTTPQALLDNVKKNHPGFLGYYDGASQRDRLAQVTHLVQAWYTTATQDAEGQQSVDSGMTVGQGLALSYPCPPPETGICTIQLPSAHAAAVTGSRLGDGLRSSLYNVIIVADPARLVDYEMGALGDYMAMLALAQVGSLDICQQLPSVLNMLAKGCADKTNALTDNDFAYLKGLYRMAPDSKGTVQKDQIAYQMEQSLRGQ